MYRLISILLLTVIILAGCAGGAGPQASPDPGQGSPAGASQETPIPAAPGVTEPPPASPAPDGTVVMPVDIPPTQPPSVSWEPVPGDKKLKRGNVFIDDSEIVVQESDPPQYVLSLHGSLPTPCHQFRAEVAKPDDQNRIQVTAYSLYNPEQVCIQVLAPLDEQVPLGSYTQGKYTVWLNGELVGEIAP